MLLELNTKAVFEFIAHYNLTVAGALVVLGWKAHTLVTNHIMHFKQDITDHIDQMGDKIVKAIKETKQ